MNRDETRSERLKRLENLLYQSAHGLTAIEIADRFGYHRTSAYRDLRSLERSGAPLWEDKGRFGLVTDHYLTTVRVNLNEALALYLSARLLSAHSDKHNPHVVSALEKLARALPESVGAHILKTAHVAAHRNPHPEHLSILETLTLAWVERRQVALVYHNPSSGETTKRVFDPYFVEPSPIGYACYVIGFDHLRARVRIFKLERIQQAKIMDTVYEIREGFDPYDYLSSAWGIMGGDERVQVKLRFSAQVAYRVRESDWPGVDTIDDLPDGGCVMTLTVSHTLEMKPWIRGWGADCEVLEPEDLRLVIAKDMIAAGKVYEDLNIS